MLNKGIVAEKTTSSKQEARGETHGTYHTNSDTTPHSGSLIAALYYHAHGCFVVPCCTMTERGKCTFPHPHTSEQSIGKRPILGEDWQHARLTREEIIDQWTKYPIANVGVLLEPSGLVVIDLDSDDATEEASRKGLRPGSQVKTASGVPHYYKNPKGIIGLTTRKGDSGKIDGFIST